MILPLHKKIIIYLIFVLTAIPGISASQTTKPASRSSSYIKRAEKVFNEVWKEVCKRNYDKQLAKKFQKKVFTQYLPMAKKCHGDNQLAGVLNRMIKEIGQSHIGVLPPVSASFNQALEVTRHTRQQPKKKKRSKTVKTKRNSKTSKNKRRPEKQQNNINYDVPGDIGLIPCSINGKLYVLQLRKGFPADLAGVKIGEQIIAIDGVKLTPDKPAPVSWSRITALMLSGYPGTTVNITLQRYGKKASLTLKRRANGFKWFKLGVMPKFFSDFEAKMLPGNIGYIRFSAFLPEEISKISRVINRELKDSDGLIVDLRDNVGGMIMATQWLAGWLFHKPVAIGTLKLNGVNLKPVSYPQVNGYRKPLAILINDGSFSCAELFPAAMQDAGAAKIFGSPTQGKCLPSQFLELPSGFRLQTVFGDHFRTTGKRVEGIGVTPDVKVKIDPTELRNGKDSVIEAAREYLVKLKSEKD
jgi:C-terminal peptidase prc